MTLLIEDEVIAELLPMPDCIAAMEEAFGEYARHVAVNRPRVRFRCTTPDPDYSYRANIIVGAVPKYNASAVRVDSRREWREEKEKAAGRGHSTPQFDDRNWGLVLLFKIETGELLAIMHDFTLSGIRVGATSAVGAKYLARQDSHTVGMFGSGKQAMYNLEALCLVRPIQKVKVFSPNVGHRRSFAEQMSRKLGIEVSPVDQPNNAVEGVDIVGCFTSSFGPVFNGEWLEPGQLVISIRNTSGYYRDNQTEVDETTFIRSNAIVVNDLDTVHSDQQQELTGPIERGLFGWDRVRELGDVVIGEAASRTGSKEILYFKNNTGMGIQFAAAAAIIYQKALEKGVARELPKEWFGTDLSAWYQKGYYPSA
jgi:alanine dehydrogenase